MSSVRGVELERKVHMLNGDSNKLKSRLCTTGLNLITTRSPPLKLGRVERKLKCKNIYLHKLHLRTTNGKSN